MGGVFCVSVFLSSNFVGGEGAVDWEASSVFEWFLSLFFLGVGGKCSVEWEVSSVGGERF